jgi:hypothetical protein
MAKTITLNASPSWPGAKNDFVLRYEQHTIGRIRLLENAWEWHVTVPMAMPRWAEGKTASLDEARKNFAAAWGRLMKETPADRLARAFELDDAAEGRRKRMEKGGEGGAKAAVLESGTEAN